MVVKKSFGIDENGNLYCDNANFSNIKIGAYDQTRPAEAELSSEGLIIKQMNSNETVILTWEDLIALKNLLSS